jgi:proteic killer suppression protein
MFYNIIVEVHFGTRKLAKIMNSEKEIVREYGPKIGDKVKKRLALLEAAPSLEAVPHTPPIRRHALSQNRKGQFSVDLIHPYRLVFEPYHSPLPIKSDGSIDLSRVTAIKIIEVEDYH